MADNDDAPSDLIFNADLVEDLARQKVVLFLGAGLSASATTRAGTRIKGWPAFLTDICQHVPPGLSQQAKDLISRGDLLLACEVLQAALAERWEPLVSAEFGQMAEPSPLHEAIVGLDQRLLLTTNFDKLIEISWEAKIGGSTHLPKLITSIDPSIFNILKDHSRKFIVKIHGTVDNPETMIFSRSEYVRLAFGNLNYSTFLEVLLLNYTFLFIGFSMNDPAIISLMEMYALRYPKARPHYIFAPAGQERNIIEINKRLRKLQAIEYDPSDNHGKLPEVVGALSGRMNKKRREIFASAIA
jgi:hypothetical protein